MSQAAPLRRRSSLRGSASLPSLPANRRNSGGAIPEAPPTASTAAIASAATTGDGHADTVLETPFEVTLDSWLGLYFVPSFMEMLKKAKKSGGLSFN